MGEQRHAGSQATDALRGRRLRGRQGTAKQSAHARAPAATQSAALGAGARRQVQAAWETVGYALLIGKQGAEPAAQSARLADVIMIYVQI